MKALDTIAKKLVVRRDRRTIIAGVILVAALLLYVLGPKFPLVIALFVLASFYLPAPAVCKSIVSRLFFGIFITLALLQIGALLQFVLFPASNFVILAIIATLLLIVAIALTAENKQSWSQMGRLRIISFNDVCGLLTALFFLIPFTPIFIGDNSIARIAEIGSIQAIDGVNHYASIAEMTQAQHLDYAPNYYYPKGFHIATAFVQSSIIPNPGELNWRTNAILYFAQYITVAVAAAYVIYYASISFLALKRNSKLEKITIHQQLLAALCIGPVLALFYLIPFMSNGFLNYYYVVATIICGLLFLANGREIGYRTAIGFYLLLGLGASMSWPLLIPPLLLVGAFFIVPSVMSVRSLLSWQFIRNNIVLILLIICHLVLVYFQLAYAVRDPTKGLDATGGLSTFHPYVLLASLAIIGGAVFSKATAQYYSTYVYKVFLSFFAFLGALLVLQYFTAGEVRYYIIKFSLLLELLLLPVSIATLIGAYLATPIAKSVKYLLLLPAVPVIVMVLLVSNLQSPLKDDRDLFRNHSGQAKPAFFDHDVFTYTKLGNAGKIKHVNSTILHYNFEQQKFFAHMQISFWSNMMQYDASRHDFAALNCNGVLYGNLAFGTYSSEEQAQLITKINECADLAKSVNQDFYIITDEKSAPEVTRVFGSSVRVVY